MFPINHSVKLVIMLVVFCNLMIGCNREVEPLNDEDFNIDYHGYAIDDSRTFEEITNRLGYGDGYEENNYGLISQVDGVRRYQLIYPDLNKPELRLVFVDDGKDSIFAFADLLNQETYRGVKVGDSINTLYEKYGKAQIIDSKIKYQSRDKSIIFTCDSEQNIITQILVDYNMEQADKAQGITSLSD